MFLLSHAWALGLGLSTLEIDATERPGGLLQETVLVQNTSDHPLLVTVTLEDWWYNGEHHAFLPLGTHERSAAGWLTIEPKQLALDVDGVAEVTIQGRLPKDAVAGYYAAAMFEGHVETGLKAGLRMATLITVGIDGGDPPPILIGIPTWTTSQQESTVSVPVTNEGERHDRVVLKGVVRDAKTERVMARLTSARMRLLPGQTRGVRAVVGTLPPGAYRLDGVVMTSSGAKPIRGAFQVQ